jgi:CDP-glucose 4,6-dehydratase
MSNDLALGRLFGGCYRGRRILLTGHTGFKGSWIAAWLERLGAHVVGYSLAPNTTPSHWSLLKLARCKSIVADLRDVQSLTRVTKSLQPEVVFHLAAQPLVRRSYREPYETFSTNVMGTLNVLQAARDAGSVRAVICVTSDKVYESKESNDGHVESDRLGGADPYSASKACAELVVSCYRQAYCAEAADKGTIRMATVRAGNVIGGGDWSEDRLIPDAVRAVQSGGILGIRNPGSVRPWQHVLEPLAGYLAVGQELISESVFAASAWNFGPEAEGDISVRDIVMCFQQAWPVFQVDVTPEIDAPTETKTLRLDSSRAIAHLGWRPLWDWRTAVARSASWYRAFYEQGKVTTYADLDAYVSAAADAQLPWAVG